MKNLKISTELQLDYATKAMLAMEQWINSVNRAYVEDFDAMPKPLADALNDTLTAWDRLKGVRDGLKYQIANPETSAL